MSLVSAFLTLILLEAILNSNIKNSRDRRAFMNQELLALIPLAGHDQAAVLLREVKDLHDEVDAARASGVQG
jgi:hypothetical protein